MVVSRLLYSSTCEVRGKEKISLQESREERGKRRAWEDEFELKTFLQQRFKGWIQEEEKRGGDQNKCRHQKGFWDLVSKPKQKGMESRTAGKTCVHKTWDEGAKVYTNYETRKLLERWQEIERRRHWTRQNHDGSKLSKDKERRLCQ